MRTAPGPAITTKSSSDLEYMSASLRLYAAVLDAFRRRPPRQPVSRPLGLRKEGPGHAIITPSSFVLAYIFGSGEGLPKSGPNSV
jgi:hypothetical protein